MKKIKPYILAATITILFSAVVFADEKQRLADEEQFFGHLRAGYITAENYVGDTASSSAFGGKLSYRSTHWNSLTAGATLYATQKLFNHDNSDFFSSRGESYAILGEAFIQGDFGHTVIKAGRFEFNSPYADTDDIRMLPNTFSGAVISNTDINHTTLYAVYLDQWSGVDSETPEDFTNLNGDAGMLAAGVVYDGIENVDIQGWYYHGSDLADLVYVEAIYAIGDLVMGAQLGSQTDKTIDNSGPNGDVYGVMASYALTEFILSAAYNEVSGTIMNGFGGGPFFTSAEDHTIGDVLDQKALAVGLEYTGIDKLSVSILHVAFDKGENETDLAALYEFNSDINIEAIYHHIYDDGNIFLVKFNVSF